MRALLLVLPALLLSAGTAAAVPGTITFTARLVDETSGVEVIGSHRASFALFVEERGGTALWTEDVDVEVEEGLLFYDLGTTKPLDATILDGSKVFLEVAIDGERLEPRIAIGSVPYALRSIEATNAATLNGVALEQLQQRITGACGSGNFVIGVNTDGSVACGPDLSGTGDITDVLPGSGLQGGGTSGTVTLSLVNCGLAEVLKFNGSVWQCAPDANAGGDITGVGGAAGGGITGGGTSGDVALSLIPCSTNQVLKFVGTWVCADDANSGGDITSVNASGNSGLTVGSGGSGDVTLSLLTNCDDNEVLKFNTATLAWGCANDNDAGGDVQDVAGGAGLTSTGTTSITLAVGQGTGITVNADNVALDLVFTDNRYDTRYDPRYVNITGDTMGGTLDMGGNLLTNRGCPTGYVAIGPGLCLENIDEFNLTFTQCAQKCRGQGNHICSAAEFMSIQGSGVTPGNGGLSDDWVDGLLNTTTAFLIADDPGTTFGSAAVTTAHACRCCAVVE